MMFARLGWIGCSVAVLAMVHSSDARAQGRSHTHGKHASHALQRVHSANQNSQARVRPVSHTSQATNQHMVSAGSTSPVPEVFAGGGISDIAESIVEYGDDCMSCGTYHGCCCNPASFLLDWTRADLWLGVNSFTGPANFLTTGTSNDGQVEGSFGYQEGFNFGSRLPSLLSGQVGAQLGMRFTQSQLDGTAAGDDSRTQTFVTAGLFRRVDYGVQGGLVVDYLHDDWVYKADLLQLRGEVSFLFSPCHDLGFRFTDSQQTDDTTATLVSGPVNLRLAGLNNYRFFYRYRFGELGRGVTEVHAGWTQDSGTVLGLNLKTPLQGQLGLDIDATYLVPGGAVADPYTQEAWNLSMAIVWTPGRQFGTARDYYRPLLDVAHNGNFLSRMVP